MAAYCPLTINCGDAIVVLLCFRKVYLWWTWYRRKLGNAFKKTSADTYVHMLGCTTLASYAFGDYMFRLYSQISPWADSKWKPV